VPRGQGDRSLRPYSRLSTPEPLLLLPSSSSVVLGPKYVESEIHYERYQSLINNNQLITSTATQFTQDIMHPTVLMILQIPFLITAPKIHYM
jgi:hypothetical protein